jgi:hypothetical protein
MPDFRIKFFIGYIVVRKILIRRNKKDEKERNLRESISCKIRTFSRGG